MEKSFSSIIFVLIASIVVLGAVSFMVFPEANFVFGAVLFVGYLAFSLIYGPTKNYMGYPSKKTAV